MHGARAMGTGGRAESPGGWGMKGGMVVNVLASGLELLYGDKLFVVTVLGENSCPMYEYFIVNSE